MSTIAPRFLLCIAMALAPAAGAEPLRTDANIVTALDISDSVSTATYRTQIAALADAIRSPQIIAAIEAGAWRRIGVAVFVWHHDRFEVVPWRLIGSAGEAEAVARDIETRIPVNLNQEFRDQTRPFIGRLTDLSAAIDQSDIMLQDAPFAAEREVINIIGNGPDNMGEPAWAARDRVVARGATINAVAFGDDAEAPVYFRTQVIGGPGAFLMTWRDGPMLDLMRAKLEQDLLAALSPSLSGE